MFVIVEPGLNHRRDSKVVVVVVVVVVGVDNVGKDETRKRFENTATAI